jgi:filamentous hemagglutinin family protein
MLNNKLHRKYPSQRMIKIGLNCLTFLASTIICMVTYSNPVLNSVTAGNATVAQTSNSTVINQTSQQAIIQWNSFNIAAGQKTQFVQPNASSVALNRINPAQGVSQIYGSLSANGRIILINAAGIHFGPSSMVNVGGMIASTSDISNANFLAGNYIFSIPSALNGSIKNEGKIIAAQHGLIALLGANVQNNGLIQAEKGSIVLGSGNIFTLDFYGDQLINFTVNEAASTGGQIKNTGALLADGGKVLVTADAAQNVLDNVIDMAGVTEARSVSNTNGEIILSGNGEVSVSGVLSVMGLQNATGGIIEVLGQSVHLLSTAKLNANGGSGGGTILVGGNFHGAGPEQNALTTTVDAGAVLTANAGLTGNGGHVAIWSNDDTQFAGSISATGGALGGNGGYVETSGSYLDVSGATVNTLAPNGITGSWLLDPTNIYIASSQANATTAGMSGTNTSANTISSGTFAGTGSIQDSLLTTATLDTALATTNVLVTTTNASGTGLGNIIVVNPITWATTKTLTLNAANNIIVNSNLLSPTITATAGGSLTLTAVNQIQLNGGITLTGTTTANGILTLSAANTTNSITTANAVSGTSIGGAINAENFTLSAGEFNQNSATLPTFNITYNFQISSGSAFNNEYNAQFTRFTGGSGTLTSPYQISDIYGLQGMSTAAFTNDYALTQNISATPTTNWFAGAGFSPVGTNQNYAYLGTFNGQNFTINGLYIHTSNNNIGLFGYADNPALLENVGLTNASIYGARFVGALVGSSGYFTSILGFSAQNVYSTGTITATNGYVGGLFGGTGYGGQILNSYSTANVISTGATDTAGGFAGQNFGSLISESYATGSVTQSAGSNNIGVGGFVGVSWVGATIQDSYSTGAVTVTGSASNKYVGGFAGQNQALIQNSYSTGNVSVSGTTTAVGGFVGINTNTTGATTPPNILNSYSTGSVTASSNAGGLVGTNTSDIGNSYTNSLLIGTTALGGLVGNNSGTITESFWNTSTTGISSLSQGCGNSANCAGATGLSMTALQTASTYTNSGWDFTTPIWTLLAGNYPVNWVIQNISGTDTGATSAPSIAVNGASVPATASIVTFSSGTYHYYLNSAALQNSAILLYNNNNGGTVSNIILPPTFPTNSYTANFGAANTIQVSNNSLSAALSNSLLANAVGTLSVGNANILYSASGTNLTIGNATNPNVTLTLATPAYALSGNLTTTGSGSFTFNGPLSLGVNNTTVSTTGSIVFGGPISWGTNNSLTVSGSNITLASNGLSAAINASSGGNLTLTASNQIQLNGGISLTGTTTLNGFLTLSAANTANSITTANAVSGTSVGGSINVENYNLLQGQWTQISTSLPAFTVTNNFELNTGTIPVSTVQFIRALSGTGSSNSPYLITDVYGLQGIGSSLTSVTQNYALNNNIDATVTANWNSGTGFVPLGNNTYQLTGNFNGQGFTINNLFINRPAGSNQGLIEWKHIECGCHQCQYDGRRNVRNTGRSN